MADEGCHPRRLISCEAVDRPGDTRFYRSYRSGFLQVACSILRERVIPCWRDVCWRTRARRGVTYLFFRVHVQVQGASDARIPIPFPRLARDRLRGRDHAHDSLAGSGAGRHPRGQWRAYAIAHARGVHDPTGRGSRLHRGGDARAARLSTPIRPTSRPCIPSWQKKRASISIVGLIFERLDRW